MAEIKGQLLLYGRDYIKQHHPGVWEKIISSCPRDMKSALENPIIAGRMYDLSISRHTLERFWKETSLVDLVKLSEESAKRQLAGLFGFIARFASFEKLFGRAQWMWDRAFSQGKIEVWKENEEVRARVSAFEFNEALQIFIQHYMKALLEICYQKKVSSSSAKKVGGCEFRFRVTDEAL